MILFCCSPLPFYSRVLDGPHLCHLFAKGAYTAIKIDHHWLIYCLCSCALRRSTLYYSESSLNKIPRRRASHRKSKSPCIPALMISLTGLPLGDDREWLPLQVKAMERMVPPLGWWLRVKPTRVTGQATAYTHDVPGTRPRPS